MDDEPIRSQAARAAAELALVRVVHHYGDRPELVVLGRLVPQLLCSAAGVAHAGTTDIDVQVDLEIAGGVVNTGRLEQALRNAEFVPDRERVWRWATVADGVRAVVQFELLVDLETEPAGFLLAKVAAAHGRRKAKDWYDIAFVLLHNDAGGPGAPVRLVLDTFGADLGGLTTPLQDLAANFADPRAQGPTAYAKQFVIDHPRKIPQHSPRTHWLPSRRSARHCFGTSLASWPVEAQAPTAGLSSEWTRKER